MKTKSNNQVWGQTHFSYIDMDNDEEKKKAANSSTSGAESSLTLTSAFLFNKLLAAAMGDRKETHGFSRRSAILALIL